MLPNRPHDNARQPAPVDAPSGVEPSSAGARYREHLAHFPERGTDTALERAAKALIRMAQIRTKAPPRAD